MRPVDVCGWVVPSGAMLGAAVVLRKDDTNECAGLDWAGLGWTGQRARATTRGMSRERTYARQSAAEICRARLSKASRKIKDFRFASRPAILPRRQFAEPRTALQALPTGCLSALGFSMRVRTT
jgi:hypothetical protein